MKYSDIIYMELPKLKFLKPIERTLPYILYFYF